MIRSVLHKRIPLGVIWIASLGFAPIAVAVNYGVGGKDSAAVRDSLRIDPNTRATISDFEIPMPRSNPLANAESLDRAIINVVTSTVANRKKRSALVPAHFILATVEKNQIAIQSLYEKYLRQDQLLRGKVTLEIVFDHNGIVRLTEITQNTTKNTRFAAELASHIRRWIMPKTKLTSSLAMAVHTFVFGG